MSGAMSEAASEPTSAATTRGTSHTASETTSNTTQTPGTNAIHTETVKVGPRHWHVERSGTGPVCLLLHGTGASAHSWRPLTPLLAEHHTTLAIDLPGHGRTGLTGDDDLSLNGMARAIIHFLDTHVQGPVVGIGHSAGAAILAEIALTRPDCLTRLVSINGAMVPFAGVAGVLFSPLARLGAGSSLLTGLFARRLRDRNLVARLLENTGSVIGEKQIRAYEALCQDPAHVKGALTMMAHWRLERLYPRLPLLELPVHLIAGSRDRMIPPRHAHQLAARLGDARLDIAIDLGHLAHEERPAQIADLVLSKVSVGPEAVDSGHSRKTTGLRHER